MFMTLLFFNFTANILISRKKGIQQNVDLLDLPLKIRDVTSPSTCSSLKTAFGGLLNENPYICCGTKTNFLEKDLILFNQPNGDLTKYVGTSSVLLDKNKVWITGGSQIPQMSKFLFSNRDPVEGPKPKPKFPFKIYQHSMVKVDSQTIYIIGGYLVENVLGTITQVISNNTWIVDPTKDFEFYVGPSMKKTGCLIGCATLSMNRKVIIVAAKSSSFRETNRLDWVEYLDTSNPANGWKIGNQFI